MEKELRAEDLFVKESNKLPMVDPEYEVVVKLSSLGKLGLPAVVHVKDYSFDDTMLFAKANQNNESAIVLKLIDSLVFEDIDLNKVTRQDVVEILMAIQGTYYTGIIDGKQYFINENLTGEALTAKENISTATIKINDIKTKPLADNVTVPIKISNKSFEILFDYPRLIHDAKAREYIDEKFAAEDNKYSELIQKRNRNDISAAELKELNEYEDGKTAEFIRVLTAQQILSFNGEKPENIDEQLKLLHKIPLAVITLLTKILEINFDFGVQSEVSFLDNQTEQPITRRFNFRYTDFIPSLEQRDGVGFDVSFG